MAQFRGQYANVKIGGTPIAATSLATTDAGDHKRYTVSDAAKAIFSRTGAVTVKVDGSAADPTTYTLDRLFGRVTFAAAQSGTAIVTIDASYVPVTTVAGAHDFEVNLSGLTADKTTFADEGWMRRGQIQRDADGSIGRFYQADDLFTDALTAGAVLLLEHWRDQATVDCRAWAIFDKDSIKAGVTSWIEESFGWSGAADADGRSVSYA